MYQPSPRNLCQNTATGIQGGAAENLIMPSFEDYHTREENLQFYGYFYSKAKL